MPMTVEEAKAKAAEMKAAAAAKRAAKEALAAGAAPPPPAVDPNDDAFVLGEHSLVLIDWDDTLFPTSAWKDRIADGAAHPPRAKKIAALSEAIVTLVRTLQQFADVKIVTHGTKGWFGKSSSVLLPECKDLLDSLDKRYRDSYGGKYMTKKPHGMKYETTIGVQVDNYGEWFKTDMFFEFISEKKKKRKWDETHLPDQVTLPRQVLIIGDGSAEKRSYDEHGNQARIYAGRPGHAAVAQVGLKGVFLKEVPNFDELVLQMRWSAAHVASTFLQHNDFRTMMWDLTGFPEWRSSLKAGPNAYQVLSQGSLLSGPGAVAPMEMDAPMGDAMDEDLQLQLALAASMAEAAGGSGAGSGAPAAGGSNADGAAIAPAKATEEEGEMDEEQRQLQEALALSLN